jgi:hypothetical protein
MLWQPPGLKRGCEYRGEKPQVRPLLSQDFCVRARRTADPSTSLRFGRDDKGRVLTHLKVCESDREFICAIRLAELGSKRLFIGNIPVTPISAAEHRRLENASRRSTKNFGGATPRFTARRRTGFRTHTRRAWSSSTCVSRMERTSRLRATP